MDLYSIQVAVEGGWSTYREPTSDVAVLHDTLTRLRREGCPCRLVKCRVLKEYPSEKADDTVLFAADRMYDAIRHAGNARDGRVYDVCRAVTDAQKAADDYDAALSVATPEVAARVRRTL
jgi:hypothetical protein